MKKDITIGMDMLAKIARADRTLLHPVALRGAGDWRLALQG